MPIRLDYKSGSIALIDIDLAGKSTFNIAEMNELIRIFEDYTEKEPNLKAILIKSSNSDFFATGPEIKDIADLDRDGARYYITVLNTMAKHIAESSVPVICAVKGSVSGIGLDIVSSCDFRLAEKKSVFADLSSKFGILSPSYLALRLVFLIGVQRAKEIILSSKIYSAGDLYRFNYLTDLFNIDEFDKGVEDFIGYFEELSIDSIRIKKRIFIDLWRNYLKNNQLPVTEIFSELLADGKDWKNSKVNFINHTL
ncbi:MAG: enoyl-CoA hydratase/isomerase family protein [bacterium]